MTTDIPGGIVLDRSVVRVLCFALFAATLSAVAASPDQAEPPATLDDASAQPGAYCPGQASTYLTLEELTVALNAVTRARENLFVLDDAATADLLLVQADTALALAVGRGSGARVANLIDAALAAKQDGHPKSALAWIPLIRHAVAELPDDAARRTADALVLRAEDMLQGSAEGDEVETLVKARQMLRCDPLHIPLRQSMAHVERLHRSLGQGSKPSAEDFSALIDSLIEAQSYGLNHLAELQRRG